MRSRLFVITLLFLLCNCKKDTQVSSSDPGFSVETFYGIPLNSGAMLAWDVTDGYSNGVLLYRGDQKTFSVNTATLLADRDISAKNTFHDSGLTNRITYYYTIVPYHAFKDGNRDISTNERTIEITPRDFASVPANQILYSTHIQPLFTNGCAITGCHAGNGEGGVHPLLKKSRSGSNLSLLSWDDVMTGTENVPQIVPFRASKSHIIQHINQDTTVAPVAFMSMPPGIQFPVEIRDLIIRWIDHGARNDNGAVAYSTMPARGWGYVTNQGEDLTAVIDLDRHKIARYITTGVENTSLAPPQAPHNAVVDWQNQFYYINLIGGNNLLKFRVSDNAKVGEVSAGLTSPAQVALSRSGDTAYVTNFFSGNNNVSVINTLTMTKLIDVSSPAVKAPHGIVITNDFQRLIVTNSTSDNVSVIRTSDNVIEKIVPIAYDVAPVPQGSPKYEPYQTAVTPDNAFAFITCRRSNEVRVLDLVQLKIIDSIQVGTTPLIPAISPDGKTLFVANRNSNSISAINTATRKIDYTIENVGVEPHGIAVSKDGKYLYVSCENLGISDPPHHATTGGKKIGFVKIVEIAKRKVVGSLEVGNFGSGMAVTH